MTQDNEIVNGEIVYLRDKRKRIDNILAGEAPLQDKCTGKQDRKVAELAERINELRLDWNRASRVMNDAEGYSAQRELRKHLNTVLTPRLKNTQAKLASIFAQQNGWKKSISSFSVKCLAEGGKYRKNHNLWPTSPVMDHPEWFRFIGSGVSAAIIGHVYHRNSLAELAKQATDWAIPHGLDVTVGEFPSWYWPKNCTLVVYTHLMERP